jgi:hypothetical protein
MLRLWQSTVDSGDRARARNRILNYRIHEAKQLGRQLRGVVQIEREGMHCMVTDNSNGIECLLCLRLEALVLHEPTDAVVDAAALCAAKRYREAVDDVAQQCCCTSRRVG